MMGAFKRAGLALAALAGLAGPLAASTVSVGGEAPNFSGTWLNHDTTSLKDLRGMAVLVDFWGTS